MGSASTVARYAAGHRAIIEIALAVVPDQPWHAVCVEYARSRRAGTPPWPWQPFGVTDGDFGQAFDVVAAIDANDQEDMEAVVVVRVDCPTGLDGKRGDDDDQRTGGT